jgi:hypothetical protein
VGNEDWELMGQESVVMGQELWVLGQKSRVVGPRSNCSVRSQAPCLQAGTPKQFAGELSAGT